MTDPSGTAVDLASTVHAPPQTSEHDPVVVLHGLFGSGRNWMTVARKVAEAGFAVHAPDLRNHGASPWSDEMTYPAMAADVARLVEQLGRPVSLVGHSMGGKAAMVLALTRPDLVRRLVVVDVAPVTYERTFLAYAQAMRAADLTGVTRRSEVDQQLAAAVPEAGVRAFLLQNLVLDGDGARWRVNLPVLEAAMPTISAWPDLAGSSYDGEVLFVAGSESHYVHPSQAAAVQPLFPRATVEVVQGAGHWVHAERPAETVALLERVLR